MALGVLNNLSAIYAENNLNNTNSSLQTVLQQLSSGSKINSGADDAAGLSLVNGLEANSTALTQSETNATEGVGLLDVADGALSQVTSLLDRAITLATEASNGTLNSSQDAAANQEYTSIMSEVNNIGSTTTYNQEQVFGGNTIAIYTGDSSTAGSSIDDLNIRTLSESSVGDTGGVMSYSNGQNNVFIDLSKGGTDAAVTDSLNAIGATTITVNYLTKGTSGSITESTANITVGAGTNYANTAQGLISAINNSGLGLSATFATASQAGSVAAAAAGAANATGGSENDTGIEISGIGVGTGTNGAGEIGTLTVGSSADTLGGTLTVLGANGQSHTITLGAANSTDTLANLAATINASGFGITASTNTGIVDGNAVGTVLTFASANSAATVSGANLTSSVGNLTLSGAPTIGNVAYSGKVGTVTIGAGGLFNDTLGGTLSIGTSTITMSGANGNNTMATLMTYINKGNYGVTASLDATGKIMTLTSANSALSFSGAPTDTTSPGAISATTNVPNPNQIGTVTQTGAGTFTSGSLNIGSTSITLGTPGVSTTLAQLQTTITNDNMGVTASIVGQTLTLTSTETATEGLTVSLTAPVLTVGALTAVTDTPAVNNSAYYSTGITGSITDTTTTGGTLNIAMVADNNGTGGTATVSYSDGAGENLSSTDLTSQSNAQVALTDLNIAISDVAAMDGYIGAQINTLNSVSSVLTTQQENVVSAQNAVQATDYASATSNMSKYEILSQTGIAALAQANSVQQEVTKLLQ